MRILWLCNVPLPDIAIKLNINNSVGGGWLVGLSNELIKQDDVELVICFPHTENLSGATENTNYYTFLDKTNNTTQFHDILKKVRPDIIHIFGTEYRHSYEMTEAAKMTDMIDKVVISIQGLVSVYANHYLQGLPRKIINGRTLRDYFRHTSIRDGQKSFVKRGVYEENAIRSVFHIIGRTDWDYACVKSINPEVTYHFCNESLRPSFYERRWTIENCQRHSIFVSQCGYPIKGFHYMLEAMSNIVKVYPDAQLVTTGVNLCEKGFFTRQKLPVYYKYLSELIENYGLQEHISFLGTLSEKEMCSQYLNAHVFASPSCIENSSNSIGEAMLLGTPVVSSDVGGVKNLLTHEKEGFVYQADAPYMLAHYIMRIFSNDNLAVSLSKNENGHAACTYNRRKNVCKLMNIYNSILGHGIL